MKKRLFFAGLLLAAYVLSGCGSSPAAVQSGAQFLPAQRLTPAADDGIYTEPEGFADRQPGRTYGEVVTVSYPAARDASRTAKVALPAGYNESTSYPVVYLFHGIHATVDTWIGMHNRLTLNNIAERADAYKPKLRTTYKMIKEYIIEKYGFNVHTAYIAEVKRSLGLPMYDAPNALETLKNPRKHPTPVQVDAIKDALTHFEII